MVFSDGYHVISNTSIVNNCIIMHINVFAQERVKKKKKKQRINTVGVTENQVKETVALNLLNCFVEMFTIIYKSFYYTSL